MEERKNYVYYVLLFCHGRKEYDENGVYEDTTRTRKQSEDDRHEVSRARTDTDNNEKFVEKKGLPIYPRLQQVWHDLMSPMTLRLANLREDTKRACGVTPTDYWNRHLHALVTCSAEKQG
eukprot:5201004-Amphidinium_carterae.1